MPRKYRRRRTGGRGDWRPPKPATVKKKKKRKRKRQPAGKYRTAVVKKGQNLEQVAKKLGTTVRDLVRQNKKLYSYKAGTIVRARRTRATGSKWRKRGKRARLKELPEAPIYTEAPIGPWRYPEKERPRTEKEMLEGILDWKAAKEKPLPFDIDLGRKRITTTEPLQYTGYAEAYAGQPARGAAPPEALRPDITGSMTEETYNRLFYQSARYIADQFRFAFGLEDDVEYFDMLPSLVPARFVREMQMNAYDMEGMGYDRIGNWWRKRSLSDMLLLEELTPTPEEVTGEGAGYYGAAGRGGGGRYGGAGGGRGKGVAPRVTETPKTFPRGLYPNITLGHFMRSIAGRQYTPEFGGMIHWRL